MVKRLGSIERPHPKLLLEPTLTKHHATQPIDLYSGTSLSVTAELSAPEFIQRFGDPRRQFPWIDGLLRQHVMSVEELARGTEFREAAARQLSQFYDLPADFFRTMMATHLRAVLRQFFHDMEALAV